MCRDAGHCYIYNYWKNILLLVFCCNPSKIKYAMKLITRFVGIVILLIT